VVLLTVEFERRGSSDGFMSIVIALLFFGTVYWLENMRHQIILGDVIRNALADYAYPVSILLFSDAFC
jgi:boron transporter